MAQVVDEMMSVLVTRAGICCKAFINGIADDKIRMLLAVAVNHNSTSIRQKKEETQRGNLRPLTEAFVPEDAGRRRTARMPVRRKAARKRPDAPIPAEKEEGQRQIQQSAHSGRRADRKKRADMARNGKLIGRGGLEGSAWHILFQRKGCSFLRRMKKPRTA
ncbi:MAG: hypothetical protein ACLSUW_05120 [Akkermansia sp.]